MRWVNVLFGIALSMLANVAPLHAADAPTKQAPTAAHNVGTPGTLQSNLAAAEQGTVRVIAIYLDENGEVADVSLGSGFVVAPERVVTNAHVISADGEVAPVLFVVPDQRTGGQRVRAEFVDGSSDFDLAVLSVPGLVAPALPLSTSIPSNSQIVHALGYPGVTDAIRRLPISEIAAPSQPYVTPGSVALTSKRAPGGMEQPTIFHTAAVNPGNSGGPLVDDCGRVVGVNTWMAAATMSDAGISVPSGQSVASQIQTLLPILARADVAVRVQEEVCVPPLDPVVQARLDAAERAVSEAARSQVLEAQRRVADQRDQTRLVQALAIAAVALMALAAAGAQMAGRNMVFRAAYRPGFVVAAALCGAVAIAGIVWLLPAFSADGGSPLDPKTLSADPTAVEQLKTVRVSASPGAQPSFDCAKAASYAEKEICRDPALARRDASMGELYAGALARGPKEEVRALARVRWAQREQCRDNACLVGWFDQRERELAGPIR